MIPKRVLSRCERRLARKPHVAMALLARPLLPLTCFAPLLLLTPPALPG